jgi:hypothetical protein
MAGTPHDVLCAALREEPTLLSSLVHALTGRTLAPGLAPVDSTVRFVKAAEVRPDVLFADGPRWAITEVQNDCDPDKRRRWLLAVGVLLDQQGTLGDLIVITAQRSVAKWARTVAHIETPLGTKLELTPVVLHVGPKTLELLLTEEHPELALVAAWAVAHRDGPVAKQVTRRALDLTKKLPQALQDAQTGAIMAVVSTRVLAWLNEAKMNPDKIPKSEALLEYDAQRRAEGKRDTLLVVLRTRELSPTDEERVTIERCTDATTLDAWVAKAVTARSVGEVLAATPRAAGRSRTAKRPAVRA